MPITSAQDAGLASLDEWVSEIRRVYGPKDEQRSMYDIWLHAMRHAAAIGEQVRRNRPSQIIEELSHFVLWLFTFIGRADAPPGDLAKGERSPEEALFRLRCSYSDLVWNKYPNRCPVCFDPAKEPGVDPAQPLECKCLLIPTKQIEERHTAETDEEKRQKEKEKRRKSRAIRKYARAHRDAKFSTVNEFQDMFGTIYGCNIERESLASIAFHLLEEVGEVADALIGIYSYHKIPISKIDADTVDWRLAQLEDEIADITSWVFALVTKVDTLNEDTRTYISQGLGEKFGEAVIPRFQLGRIIWSSYGSPDHKKLWCKHCKSETCKCRITFLTTEEYVGAVAQRLPVEQ